MSDEPKLTKLGIRTPDATLVSHVEKLLEQAKSGELTGLAYVAIWHGNNVNSSWCQVKFAYLRTIIGEIRFLVHALIAVDK